MDSIKFSIHDKNFVDNLTEEIIEYCKRDLRVKTIRKKVYNTLKEELERFLKNRLATEYIELQINSDANAAIILFVAYNVISYSIMVLGMRVAHVGDIACKTRCSSSYYALSFNNEKLLKYNARRVKSVLESMFPEFKFPNPDNFEDVYNSLIFEIEKGREEIEKYIDSRWMIVNNVLYIANGTSFLFVTERGDLFYTTTRKKLSEPARQAIGNNFTMSRSSLSKLIAAITGKDYKTVLNNLGDVKTIESLVKNHILNNL